MSSLPATLHPLNPWTIFVSTSSAAPARRRHLCSFGGNFPEHGRRKSAIPSPTCNAASNARVIQDVWPNNFSILDRTQVLLDAVKEECQEPILKVPQLDEVGSRVKAIKEVLGSLEDGKISPSAYDTAWVALVRDVHGSGAPQFPSALEWVVDNQHPDGSWGDPIIFLAHDRIINTLACVIALKSWDVQPQLREKGLSFLRKNMAKLEEEDHEHMPIGFEVVFPSLMEIARCLNLNLPFDAPYLQEIYARRELKLDKIPKEIFHQVPTPLLHSLEGIPDLDWEKMLKLQGPEGSFLFSPSATAFAFIETGNEKCFEYIQRIVERFNGGVPNVYPVDLFEHLWAVDRIQRLGISRHFQTEIRSCLEYVHRYWSEDGICWARNSAVMDVDDTAMAFRLLRLHGFDISPDAFRKFEKEGKFFCLAGQSNQAVTGMFNLYRASQVSFPGEKILEDARTFSRGFLREKQIAKQLLDKWIIASDLPGEVNYALDFPWYASLPRIETRFYLGHYGGEQDVWIGKTLYRMPCVSNNEYLELAKLDFIKCQQMYQLEWVEVQKWYNECGLEEMGLSERAVLHAYFVAAASIFEPERAAERLAWARTAALIEVFRSHIGNSSDLKQTVLDFVNTRAGSSKVTNGLTRALQHTLRLQSWEVLLAHGRDVRHHIRQAWEQWLRGWQEEDEDAPRDAELLVRAINLSAGRPITDDISSRPTYHYLSSRTSHVCSKLRNLRESKVLVYNGGLTVGRHLTQQGHSHLIDDKMQEIAQGVLCRTDDLALDTRQAFLTIAKGFYYMAHCSPANLNQHIAKVLFERVA